MFNNKSPGNDGLSKELHETSWEDIKYVFINSLKQAKIKGSLSISKRKLVAKLLEKKDWDKRFIENWSPISLLNVDTKYYWKHLQQNLNLFYHLLFFKSNCVCRKTVHQCKLGKNCFEKNWLWQKLYHLDKNIIKWWKILRYKWKVFYSVFYFKRRCTPRWSYISISFYYCFGSSFYFNKE